MALDDYREVIEDVVTEFINEKREDEGRLPLKEDEELVERARSYSRKITVDSGPGLGTKRGKHYWLQEECPYENCAEVSAKVRWNQRDAKDIARQVTEIWISKGRPTMASKFDIHGVGVWVEPGQDVVYATQTLAKSSVGVVIRRRVKSFLNR